MRSFICQNPSMAIAVLLLTVLASASGFTQQTDAERIATEEKLEAIKTELSRLAEQRELQNSELDRLQAEAQETAQRLIQVRLRMQQLTQQQHELHNELSTLGEQALEQQSLIQAQQIQLGQQVKNAYINAYRSRLQVLLSQDDGEAAQLAWKAYFANRRGHLINELRQQQDAIETTRMQIIDRQSELETLVQQLQTQDTHLSELESQQKSVFASIREQLSNLDERFAELQLNQQQLETLLEALRDLFVDIPEQLDSTQFNELRGKLPWPLADGHSQLLVTFGSERTNGITWSGIVIECPEDTQVKAIAPGRVAFADWMRGFGWLVVIEHSDGYMSLYGNNSQLLQSTGSWVRAGETIATSGSSFTADALNGVYFELRQNGEALNPEPWLNSN